MGVSNKVSLSIIQKEDIEVVSIVGKNDSSYKMYVNFISDITDIYIYYRVPIHIRSIVCDLYSESNRLIDSVEVLPSFVTTEFAEGLYHISPDKLDMISGETLASVLILVDQAQYNPKTHLAYEDYYVPDIPRSLCIGRNVNFV